MIKKKGKWFEVWRVRRPKRKSTSLPRRSFTKEATSAKSKFKATKPLLPRFPNSMSGFTTNFEDKSHGSFSGSSLKSVDSVIWGIEHNKFIIHVWYAYYTDWLVRYKFIFHKSVIHHIVLLSLKQWLNSHIEDTPYQQIYKF